MSSRFSPCVPMILLTSVLPAFAGDQPGLPNLNVYPGVNASATATPLPPYQEPHVFSVVAIPDTQNYSEFYPQIFRQQTNWIANSLQSRNIKFVTHVGDVVNHGDRANEWANSRLAMDTLDRAGVPYGVTAGNHDITPSGTAGSPYIRDQFLANYGPQRYNDRSWYKGASPSGMSNYQVFTGGGREFLIMHLECDTPLRELEWAQGVLNKNRDKPTMITTHRYLQDAEDYTGGVPIVPSGRYPSVWYGVEGTYTPDGIQSDELYNSFIRTNKQVFMVNCGHFHEEYRQTSSNLWGAPVHEILADYQDDPNGGNGFLRMMNFNVNAGRVDVESYSPYLKQHRTADESRFSLNVNFDSYARTTPSLSFQNGINGYQGTQDTWISQENANTSYGNNPTFDVDDDVNNSIFSDRRGQALLRFDDITTTTGQEGRIPLGAVVTEATLRLVFQDDVDSPIYDADFFVHMMTRSWDESSTWNSLSGGLTQGSDYGTLIGTLEGDNSPDGDFWRMIDVSAAVQRWVNGEANFGFAIVPEIISGNDDGITIWSSENANALYRPVLDVTYYVPRTIPTPSGLAVFALAATLLIRRRRG